jgi:hypothetical protein
MPIVSCPKCANKYNAAPEQIGLQFQCPACSETFTAQADPESPGSQPDPNFAQPGPGGPYVAPGSQPDPNQPGPGGPYVGPGAQGPDPNLNQSGQGAPYVIPVPPGFQYPNQPGPGSQYGSPGPQGPQGVQYPNQPGQANVQPAAQYGYPAPYQPELNKTDMSFFDLIAVIFSPKNAPYKFKTATILTNVGHKLASITLILTLISFLFSLYVIIDINGPFIETSLLMFLIYIAVLFVMFGVLIAFSIYWSMVVLDYLTTLKNKTQEK